MSRDTYTITSKKNNRHCTCVVALEKRSSSCRKRYTSVNHILSPRITSCILEKNQPWLVPFSRSYPPIFSRIFSSALFFFFFFFCNGIKDAPDAHFLRSFAASICRWLRNLHPRSAAQTKLTDTVLTRITVTSASNVRTRNFERSSNRLRTNLI